MHQDQAVDKAKGFCREDVGLPTHEYVSEGEGLRKEILSKTHHSPNTVFPRNTKMYKGEEKSELECRLTKHSMDGSVSHPCIGRTLERENVGA